MKTFLTILSYIPLLIVGAIMIALIYDDGYTFITIKIFASVGIFAIVYGMYRFTGYLHKKVDERYSNMGNTEQTKKKVLVYGGVYKYGAKLYMHEHIKELIEHGINVTCVDNEELYFETDKVEVRFITNEQQLNGRACDAAFGFDKCTFACLLRKFKTPKYEGKLVDYILLQENS